MGATTDSLDDLYHLTMAILSISENGENNQSLNANETKGNEFFINISKDPILIDGIVNIFRRLIRVKDLRELSELRNT